MIFEYLVINQQKTIIRNSFKTINARNMLNMNPAANKY